VSETLAAPSQPTTEKLAPPVQASRDELKRWYALMHLGRVLDDKAPNYLKQGLGWSYHAPAAGHDGIQTALGVTFQAGRDYLFPY
jgi:2-oxoisovalerate dehydrogenase E1 component